MSRRSPLAVAIVATFLFLTLPLSGVHREAVTFPDPSITVERREPETTLILPRAKRDWTVLFYNAADFYGYNPVDDFARRMRSSPNVNVVMLEDTFEGEATVWLVEGTAQAPVLIALEEWGEINMGDDDVLTEILTYCQTTFPSRRTMLMIYQHDAAWRGAVSDAHPIGTREVRTADYLTPEEMRVSLDSVGGIDALLFTAPCLMGAIEPIHHLRNSMDLYIGSEPRSGFAAWVDALPEISDLLSTQPDLEPTAKVAMTAVASTSDLDAFASALDAFAVALMDVLEDSIEEIRIARNDSQDLNYEEVVDSIVFAKRCESIPGLEAASAAFQEAVSRVITDALFNREAFPGATGLSIFFPFRKNADPLMGLYNTYAPNFLGQREHYAVSGLSLVEETRWDEFLAAFYSIVRDPDSRDS